MFPSQFLIINGAVLAGAVFLGASLVFHLKAVSWIPPEIRGRWTLMAGLMGFFLSGYLFFLVIQILDVSFPLEVLTAAVFFGGGLFVLVVTRVTLKALAQVAAHEKELENINEELQHSNVELVQAYDRTIEGWSRALEQRDQETEGHTRRVARMTRDIAARFGMTEEQLTNVTRGALLHDIGKMAVSDSILMKEGPLTEEEREIMQNHPLHAYELLSPIPYLHAALDIPYCHHERWDGKGYPRGLKGEEIPLAARIFAVADTWDALVSARRYHEPWSQGKVCEHIKAESGKHFDPAVVEKFLEMDWCR